MITDAAAPNRKPGVADRRDLQFASDVTNVERGMEQEGYCY
jgi:hypothetical protein